MPLWYTFIVMKQLPDSKTPSNKVGLALVVVVLIVAGTIFGSKIKFDVPIKDLQNVELVVERKTQSDFKSGDADEDRLPDWLEEFYKTDPNNPDTDGDGTKDGEEVDEDRDPAVAGPDDPLITRKDLIETEADLSDFTPGTLTDKTSIELFSQYMNLKKQGTLKTEDETKLVEDLSKKVTQEATLKPKYVEANLYIVNSTKETITVYGDRVAQVASSALLRMDSYKNLKDMAYLSQIAKEYKTYAEELSQVRVPSVTKDIHLQLINYLYNTGVFFDSLVSADADPLSSLVVLSQYKTMQVNDTQLYTSLSQYFKNNAIIFDTESTVRFWSVFGN